MCYQVVPTIYPKRGSQSVLLYKAFLYQLLLSQSIKPHVQTQGSKLLITRIRLQVSNFLMHPAKSLSPQLFWCIYSCRRWNSCALETYPFLARVLPFQIPMLGFDISSYSMSSKLLSALPEYSFLNNFWVFSILCSSKSPKLPRPTPHGSASTSSIPLRPLLGYFFSNSFAKAISFLLRRSFYVTSTG